MTEMNGVRKKTISLLLDAFRLDTLVPSVTNIEEKREEEEKNVYSITHKISHKLSTTNS